MPPRSEGPALSSVALSSVAISVESLDRAVGWWGDVFGASVLTRGRIDQIDAEVAVLAGPGLKIELLESKSGFRVPALDAEPPAHLFPIGAKAIVLQADDVPAVTRELEGKGVTFVWKNMEMLDQGPVTAIRDSEGNLMTIVTRTVG